MAAAAAFYLGEGDCIDYTPDADMVAGEVVDLGDFVGIMLHDTKANELGSFSTFAGPLWRCNKYTGEEIALGAKVYYDAGTNTFTATSAYSEGIAGYCMKAAAASDDTVDVKLAFG